MEQSQLRIQRFLTQIAHRKGEAQADLSNFLVALKEVPDIVWGHFSVWNMNNGTVNDLKVAAPVIGTLYNGSGDELYKNALCVMARLNPRMFLRALEFHKKNFDRKALPMSYIKGAVKMYLRLHEQNENFDRTILRHRKALHSLYAKYHVKPGLNAQAWLFDNDYRDSELLGAVASLSMMTPLEAAATIREYHIPVPVLIGAVEKFKTPEIMIAALDVSTGNETVQMIEQMRKIAMDDQSVADALELALERAAVKGDIRAAKADKVMSGDRFSSKLASAATAGIKKAINANVVIAVDVSDSMNEAREWAAKLAAYLAPSVTGNLYMYFFNSETWRITVNKDWSIEQIKKQIPKCSGSTWMGGPFHKMTEQKLDADIYINITDYAENEHPYFHKTYQDYVDKVHDIAVYNIVLGRSGVYTSHHIGEYIFPTSDDAEVIQNIASQIRPVGNDWLQEVMDTPLLENFTIR